MIWFTSDTHFGHIRILDFGRNEGVSKIVGTALPSIAEHDAMLIKSWNRVVQPFDTVYHLGDFALARKAYRAECWHALNGKKLHVLGNHDDGLADLLATPGIHGSLLPSRLHTLRHEKRRYELCHFPLEVWDGVQRGAIHLHGHSHDGLNTRPNAKRLDVGVDTAYRLLGEYRPFSITEVLAIMETRTELGGVDHHGR